MLSQSRPDGPVPSFASTTNSTLSDKENTPIASPHSHSRRQGARSRRRCARTLIPHSQSLSTSSRAHSHRARRHAARTALLDSLMGSNNEASSSTRSTQQALLPRRLPRPIYREIDLRNIAIANPSLEGIPLHYILQNLKDNGPQLLLATRAVTTPFDKSRRIIQREITLTCNDVSMDPPSHVIVACSKKRDSITIVPAHAIVLSAYCANLPPLPVSRPSTPSKPGETITIPVFAFHLPNPTLFPILLAYLYTKRADLLRNILLPAHATSSTVPGLVQAHATSMSQKELFTAAGKVKALWHNTCTLGIFDDPLFRVLEFAWDILVRALERKATQAGPSRSVSTTSTQVEDASTVLE